MASVSPWKTLSQPPAFSYEANEAFSSGACAVNVHCRVVVVTCSTGPARCGACCGAPSALQLTCLHCWLPPSAPHHAHGSDNCILLGSLRGIPRRPSPEFRGLRRPRPSPSLKLTCCSDGYAFALLPPLAPVPQPRAPCYLQSCTADSRDLLSAAGCSAAALMRAHADCRAFP